MNIFRDDQISAFAILAHRKFNAAIHKKRLVDNFARETIINQLERFVDFEGRIAGISLS